MTAEIGHNSGATKPMEDDETQTSVGGVASGQLRSIVERIERLEEEKAALLADIREVFAEAKSNGYDPKILRQVIRIRKIDGNERAEQEALLDTYMAALGML